MKKRLLSLALCLVLVVGLFSGLTVNASAGIFEDIEAKKKEIIEKLITEKIEQFKEEFEIPDLDTEAIFESFTAAATEGDFGVNNCLHWEVKDSLLDGKTLTISGTGAMPDFDFPNGNLAPWWNYKALGMIKAGIGGLNLNGIKIDPIGDLKKVVIKDGVTNVSNYALFFLPAATQITLPESAFTQKTVDVTDDDGNVTGTKTVRVADMNTVSGILKDYGLINYKWLFQLYSRFSNAEVQLSPGTYALTTNLDYRALVKKMQTGADSQLQTLVMFPEGYNLDQVFARLEENGVCSREDLYAAAANAEFSYAFLEGVETGDPYRLEGFLFPDTYYFYQGMQASSAINKFLSNLHYRITDEMWQKAQAMNLTFKQVITVASLIEREAANDAERATIASVIYNRLNIGMPLQLDSTVVYAIRETGETTMSTELIQATDSPYNTYLYQGLPPGPICNPGMKSIEAALNPEQTGYYYFALDMETKSMRFFTTLAEHEAFVATQDYG